MKTKVISKTMTLISLVTFFLGVAGSVSLADSVSSTISDRLDFGFLQTYSYGNNQSAGSYTWTDEDTGKVYFYKYPKRGSINSRIEMLQGFLPGTFFVPVDSEFEIRRLDNEGTFAVNTCLTVAILPEEMEWEDSPKGRIFWNAFGLEFSGESRIYHDIEWFWMGDDQDPFVVETNDVVAEYYFSMSDSVVESISTRVYDSNWWINNEEYDAFRINGEYIFQYEGENLNFFNSVVPLSIPEPVTLSVLLFGGVGVILRRRQK